MRTDRVLADIKAVILDMDGLVLDTESSYFKAWQMAAEKMGHHLTDRFCLTLSGLQYQDVERRIQDYCGTRLDLSEFNRLSGHCWREHVAVHGIAIKKGFFDLLRVIREKNLSYCLATNSLQQNALQCLRYAGLEAVFPLLVGREAVAEGKPSPAIFYRAATMMNHPISVCLIVEDSPTGIAAASQTSAQSVFVPSVSPADADSSALADFVVADLKQLAEIVQLAGVIGYN
ncbi:HAD family phosphatase [Methylomarinum sp. Ch1-1]|uniref:HAD family phosphatase n=1 Tax=Methylomarinum roseum TaxID=3067653 RepID=A0AAU7NRR8_9GAMM|nr:HAD family phosphatase [Methylomarinum sp. Ch1-1]MDP4520346.1 HAD family phosphatase [Methylomarinum sp. Ch1-1]